MPVICPRCGTAITNNVCCGTCGLNKSAAEAIIARDQGYRPPQEPFSSPAETGVVSGSVTAAVEGGAQTSGQAGGSGGDRNKSEIATIQAQIADLKAEIKRVEGEIDALFKERKSTSSLEWYFFAIDQNLNYNDPDGPNGLAGFHSHLFSWALFGFIWIPIGYVLWHKKRAERATWDKTLVREANRKVNEQIKAHRNRRTALLGELNALKSRLKEIAGQDYSPTWQDGPSGAATVALNGAVKETTSGLGRLVKGVVGAVPVGTCPSCKQNWAKESDGEVILGTDYISAFSVLNGRKPDGDIEGTVTKVAHYNERYRCKKCSHRWGTAPKSRRTTHSDLCPACYQEGTKDLLRTEEIETIDHSKAEVIMDSVHVDRNKELVGATYREVKTPLRTIRYRHFFHCKACERGWSTISSKTFRL